MTQIQTIDFTTARKNLSKIVDEVFLKQKSVIISKRNIPLAQIVSIDNKQPQIKKNNKVDHSLFGIWKDKDKSTLELAAKLRDRAWKGRQYDR